MEGKRFGVVEFCIGLLMGLATGAALGLLLAPRSGTEMRGQIVGRASDIKSTASELVGQARHSIELAASQVERVVGLQERNLRKKLDEIKSQLDEFHLNEA